MMAQLVPHQPERNRVKVYELRNNDWFDLGTGFCTAALVDVQDGKTEPRVMVHAEDSPDRTILDMPISKDGGFQKQQETLIVWTDHRTSLDMALSFEEPEACVVIWRFVHAVQQRLTGSPLTAGAGDDSLSDDLAMEMTTPIQLPAPIMRNIPELEATVRLMSSTAESRDSLTKAIIDEDYIKKLIPLFEKAENLESLADLHHICNIMKTILLLNDNTIFEIAVSDECILGVVGALEYDADFPRHKANHRQWLENQGRYREVVHIDDPLVRYKIHQIYRLQYLKDVVLARILDDPTFSVLNSLVFFNQVDILQSLQNNLAFLRELFAVLDDAAERPLRKKEAVLFIQQCCTIAKNLQQPTRHDLYQKFMSFGLIRVINYGLRNVDVAVRVAATDMLVSMIDHDATMIWRTIYRQIHENYQPLLIDTFIDLLLVEVDLGIRSQMSDVLKVLLEPNPPSHNPENHARPNGEIPPHLRTQALNDAADHENFLTVFYEHSVARLFRPLTDLKHRTDMNLPPGADAIFTCLSDIMAIYIRQHYHRMKFFIFTYNIPERFVQLLECKEKHLQLVPIRFFRSVMVLKDEFYTNQLTSKSVLGPILDVLLRTMPRDNLLCSACLDFFETMRRDDHRDLMRNLVENHREKVTALSYLETFEGILTRFERTRGFLVDPYILDPEEDDMSRRQPLINGAGHMMEHITVDPDQDEYWNTSDDDEDDSDDKALDRLSSHGPNIPSRPLVDYNSDSDDNSDTEMTVALPEEAKEEDTGGGGGSGGEAEGGGSGIGGSEGSRGRRRTKGRAVSLGGTKGGDSAALAQPPRERVSEKRRRDDEEDDDELGKLMISNSKRRNSSSQGMSSSPGNSPPSGGAGGTGGGRGSTMMRQRAKSASAASRQGAGSPSPKIAISLNGVSARSNLARRDDSA